MKKNRYLLIFFIPVFISLKLNAPVTLGSDGEPLIIEGKLLGEKKGYKTVNNLPQKGTEPMPRIRLNSLTIPSGQTNLATTVDGLSDEEYWDKDMFVGLIIYNINSCPLPGIYEWDGNSWKPIAQINTIIDQSEDSILSDKGNLDLLVERVYLAFKAYRTGDYEFNEGMKSDSIHQARQDSMREEGWILNFLDDERPLRTIIIRGGKPVSSMVGSLNHIPIDSVQSIKVMKTDASTTAIYGLGGVNGVIIELKE
ncbi:MAG: hypothetical protein LBV43_02735 [Prevotella sp.]|jgi:hypothetical protein|nr:hypothetical protein [Prevotella sp.]